MRSETIGMTKDGALWERNIRGRRRGELPPLRILQSSTLSEENRDLTRISIHGVVKCAADVRLMPARLISLQEKAMGLNFCASLFGMSSIIPHVTSA